MTTKQDQADVENAKRLDRSIRTLLRVLTMRGQDQHGDGRLSHSGTEIALIGVLHEQPGSTGREVGRFLGLTPTTV